MNKKSNKLKSVKQVHIKHKGAKQLEFLTSDFKKSSREFGGALLKSRRKSARPLSASKALHLVLRVSDVSSTANDTREMSTANGTRKVPPPNDTGKVPLTNDTGKMSTANDTRESLQCLKDTLDITKQAASNNCTGSLCKTGAVSLGKTGAGSLRYYKNSISSLLNKYSQKFGVNIYKYAIAGNHIHIVFLCRHRLQYRAWIRTLTGQLSARFKIKWGHRPWSRVLSWGKEFFAVTKYVLQNILEAEGVIAYKPRKYRRS